MAVESLVLFTLGSGPWPVKPVHGSGSPLEEEKQWNSNEVADCETCVTELVMYRILNLHYRGGGDSSVVRAPNS